MKTKKSETFKITAKEIVQAYENPQYLKDTFPSAFGFEIENNKWYVSTYINDKGVKSLFIAFIEDLKTGLNYGFDFNGNWETNMFFETNNNHTLKPATPQEVTEALTKEAVKKGFVEGAIVKCLDYGTISKLDFEYKTNFDVLNNTFYYGGKCVFKNGTWATMITETQPKELTVKQIEEQLGYSIKIVKE